MIYSHKPQRSGRSIQANTNNPPQDPPPPLETTVPEIIVPDILIADSTPPVLEPSIQEAPTLPKPEKKVTVKTPKKVTPKPEKKVITKPVKKVTPKPVEKITWRNKLVSFFKKLFRRSA